AEAFAKRVEKWRPPVKPGLARQLVGYTVLIALLGLLAGGWGATRYYNAQYEARLEVLKVRGFPASVDEIRGNPRRQAMATEQASDRLYNALDYLDGLSRIYAVAVHEAAGSPGWEINDDPASRAAARTNLERFAPF